MGEQKTDGKGPVTSGKGSERITESNCEGALDEPMVQGLGNHEEEIREQPLEMHDKEPVVRDGRSRIERGKPSRGCLEHEVCLWSGGGSLHVRLPMSVGAVGGGPSFAFATPIPGFAVGLLGGWLASHRGCLLPSW